jgi:two-component system, OmpR family, heavy metal sensor histidine kinase CusS
MTTSVARRVAGNGALVLVTTLALVGIGTGAALHVQRTNALDEALLAAVHGRAHPDVSADVEIEIEHARSPVDTWLVAPEDPRVPREAARNAKRAERPLFTDVGDRRLVLLEFEVEHEHGESKLLAAASAPRMTLRRSVGSFALSYSLAAALAALVASVALGASVRHEFRPLDRAREEASRVVDLAGRQRLTEDGPVEIRSLIVAINGLLERLDVAHRAQSRFTAEAAHELRTPVTTMLGELDVALRSGRTREEYREVLVSSRDEVERLRRLVEGLTALARIDAGQIERGRERVRATELATSALKSERKTLARARSNVRLEVVTDPELEAERSLVEVALANLLRNAALHAPGAEVVLSVKSEDQHVIFDIDDAGAGVSVEEREPLFDRFARTGEARQRERTGLGLGLPIAREIARRHGGDCTLADSPAGGLRARLTLKITNI